MYVPLIMCTIISPFHLALITSYVIVSYMLLNLEIENESPPPPPRVVIPSAGIENSANFTSPTLSSETVGY